MSTHARQFSAADTVNFAAVSADWNPIHVDPIASRRAIGNGQVVHGMHLVLWGLDSALAPTATPRRLARIQVEFRRQVRVDDRVRATIDAGGDRVRIGIHAEDRDAVTVEATLESAADVPEPLERLPARAPECREWGPNEIAGAAGTLPLLLDRERTAMLVPRLIASLPAGQLATMLALSRLVGMECPGRHSMLHRIDATFDHGPHGPQLRYRVTAFDPRFSSVRMAVETGAGQARVAAFLAPTPAAQRPSRELIGLVAAAEFAGIQALVVGGSRGLGEATSKLLAAGGAAVTVGYHAGRDDAERVCADIIGAGGQAVPRQLDVLAPDAAEAMAQGRPTHLFYFATPPIRLGESTTFSPERFRQFGAFYVEAFVRAVDRCVAARPELVVFYPSTTALDAPTPGAQEYCAAKAAGETAGQQLMAAHRGLRIVVRRLPRTRTDATATVAPVESADATDVMLPLLRALPR